MRQVALAPCSPFSVSRGPAPGERHPGPAVRASGSTPTWRRPRTRRTTPWSATACAPWNTWPLSAGPGSDVWYAHGIHFNDEELRELAQHRHRRGPLPHQQHEARLGRRPGPGDAAPGRPRGPGRGRLRQQRRLLPAGGAPGVLPAPPAHRQRRRPHRATTC